MTDQEKEEVVCRALANAVDGVLSELEARELDDEVCVSVAVDTLMSAAAAIAIGADFPRERFDRIVEAVWRNVSEHEQEIFEHPARRQDSH